MKTIARMGLLWALLAVPAVVQADDYTYKSNSDNTINITGYTGAGGALTIPSIINNMRVTSIGNSAFQYCSSITSITISSIVTNIGDWAFRSCSSLTSVTIGYGVTSIGIQAFAYCSRLTSVMIGNGVTSIGIQAFAYCTSLTSVTIPVSVASIGDGAFGYCTNITSVTIPNSVTSIGISAFFNCSSLTNVMIGNGVTSIGDRAFFVCFRLTSVTIPNSVTNIGIRAFYGCTNLTAITVGASNSVYSSVGGVLFNKSRTTLIQYPGGKAGSYTIPSSVTNIGDNAFEHCTDLTGVTIPVSVTSIGGYAFDSCYGLTGVTIPGSVTSLGDDAFVWCTSLTSVYFKGNAPGLGGSLVFSGDNNATVYYLPGTTNWTNPWGGLPTMLWNPHVPNDVNFGVQANQFGFTIAGTSNLTVVVEACTNLLNPVWCPVGTNTLTGGSSYFGDPLWTNDPVRFYRIHSPFLP